jgi:molybdenum cofactor cytidylyltransferase
MGTPKQLLAYEGRSLLRHAVESAVASVCRPILVVLGAYAHRLYTEIQDLPLQQVMNEQWAEGISSSIRRGLGALEEHDPKGSVEAVVLMLCDQPCVTAVVIDDLVAAYHSSGKGMIASEYGGTVGVPALFRREHFMTLAALNGAAGAQHVIAAHRLDLVSVPFPMGTTDVDTPEDYLELQQAGRARW